MMKILLTADPAVPVPPLLYGGIERIIDALVTGLRARGHRIALVAHAQSACPVDELFAWPTRETERSWSGLSNILTLKNAARDFKPDLIHSFSRLLNMLTLLAARVPKIMSYQRFPTRRTVASALRVARGTLQFTGCSQFICGQGRAAGGEWSAIPNFVDVQRYVFSPVVPADAPLVFLSRIERIKGAHSAVAMARLAGRRLIIAGNHETSGEAGTYWREVIEPEIGRGGVEYVGPVNDRQKNDLLGQAAALVVPIEWDEPFGIVFAEALACGTPVISCARGALPEIVQSGVQGFLVKTNQEGAEAISRLGTLDRGQCRRRVEDLFSADVVVRQYESLYEKIVTARRRDD